MSYAIDVNVLLYGSDEASVHHAPARRFLRECSRRMEPFCLAWVTLVSYLRIATHPRIFSNPLTPRQAVNNVEQLVRLPQVRLLSESEGFLDIYSEVTGDLVVRGNLVPDAHLAALLKQHGVDVLYSRDRDLKKFDFLEVRDPFIQT